MNENLLYKSLPQDGTRKAKKFIYAERIKVSEELRCLINKEHDPLHICNMALLCISVMLGDQGQFYENNRNKIIKLYRREKKICLKL